jgi:hypothetical protein
VRERHRDQPAHPGQDEPGRRHELERARDDQQEEDARGVAPGELERAGERRAYVALVEDGDPRGEEEADLHEEPGEGGEGEPSEGSPLHDGGGVTAHRHVESGRDRGEQQSEQRREQGRDPEREEHAHGPELGRVGAPRARAALAGVLDREEEGRLDQARGQVEPAEDQRSDDPASEPERGLRMRLERERLLRERRGEGHEPRSRGREPQGGDPPQELGARAEGSRRLAESARRQRGGARAGDRVSEASRAAGRADDGLLAAARRREETCVGGACRTPGNCFGAGTPSEDGLVAIETVAPGDRVLARDEASGELGWFPVVQTFAREAPSTLTLTYVTAERLESLVVTAEHPFHTPYGWRGAGELQVGERIDLAGGGHAEVLAWTRSEQPTLVFNFEVETAHTYFVGEDQLWTHNTCGRGDALSRARRDLGIPHGQQPESVRHVNLTDRNNKPIIENGRPVQTREYIYRRSDGSRVVIQEHSRGQDFGEGGVGDQPPHFNVRPIENTRTGTVPGTSDHYYFEP